MAGLKGKEEDFWEFLVNFDVIDITETWIEENYVVGIKARAPSDFVWKIQRAVREKGKGELGEGIWLGFRKGLEVGETWWEKEGFIGRELIGEKRDGR